MLARLADLAAARSKLIVVAAAVFFVAAAALGGSVADRLDPFEADDPATESVQAQRALERAGGADSAPGVVALIRDPAGVRRPAARAKAQRLAAELRRDPAVVRVATWYETRDPAMLSRDGRATYVAATFKPISDKQLERAAERIDERMGAEPGVDLGGLGIASVQVNHTVESDLRRAELMAFPILFLLSLVFFRSLVAALLPLLVGGLAIVTTFLALRVASELGSISVFALNLTIGLGLGLAIDYSLLIVSRYREEVAAVGPGREALRRTLATAGRTVLFSSLTVAAAMASLLVFPQRFLYSMGLGGVMVSLIGCAVALVVLPAILALLGPRINALAPKRLQRAADSDARPGEGPWYRLAHFVMRRPGRVALATAALLVALGLPFLSMKFTTVDPSVLPRDSSARQVYEALRSEFPPNRDAPVSLVVSGEGDDRALVRRLQALPGVDAVAPAQPLSGDVRLVQVYPTSTSFSEASQDLVRRIRALHTGPLEVKTAGETAELVDLKSSITGHLPLVFAIIGMTTFAVLFLMTGSVVLPLKALVMNVLTISAAFGIIVLIFQEGRFQGLLDYERPEAIDTTMPVLLFVIAFGLSTDYGVFLLSRIKEARDRGASDREAVAIGLERTGRIVTAAAVLFCVAIGAFATSQIVFIKENGVGTAVAVLIDATIVRALLVPALMALLGRWNWWAPRPLRRLHARFGLSEGARVPA